VQESKLSAEEKLLMESDFSLPELDAAVKDMRVRTAPGPDGISNAFIKKFWPYLRIPLLKYGNHSINSGSLTDSFKTAAIRLIPKKDDCSDIKNWRPISLLNCIYKVLSKALNNRFKKVSARILSRAQKGFTKGRYIQECIINISESVSFANNNNIPGFVLALDMAKAFDTVRHDYMNDVYRFFGFGDRAIRMIETLTIGRNACIIWDDGSYSEKFDLGTGSGQGNGPSPLQFNFCEQILLFKIELDPRIESIFEISGPFPDNPVTRAPPPKIINLLETELNTLSPGYRSESDCSTDKIEGFADDGSVIGKATEGSITAIKENLSNFALLSGLKCNVQKSVIMVLALTQFPNAFQKAALKSVPPSRFWALRLRKI
jgi:Reverse transcriptase (RNA-dependent DNA polymerase)